VRLGAGPSSATLVNLHIVRRVALSQANIWSSQPTPLKGGDRARAVWELRVRVAPKKPFRLRHLQTLDHGHLDPQASRPEAALGSSFVAANLG
jgi:hypothetical protein